MITTIKLEYSSEEFQPLLKEMRRQQSIAVRSAFKRLQRGMSNKEIYAHLKTLNGLNLLDSWWLQSAIDQAKIICSSNKKSRVVFGGKNNLKRYQRGLISKEEYRDKRTFALVSIGEAKQRGNRKFRLDLDNNKIMFQDCRGNIKCNLTIKPQHRERLVQLMHIEDATRQKELPLSVWVDDIYIYMTFEPKQKEIARMIKNRVLSIDTNPNSIGWSVTDIKGDQVTVIDSGVIELTELNKQSKNKKHFEMFRICKFLADKATHYKCEMFAVEDLSIKSKDNQKGKKYNKLVNNDWLRTKLFSNLSKRCFVNNIKFTQVNPAFTSIIGGVLHSGYPDPIAPTFEIARRAVYKYQKDKFYPALPSVDVLNELWKQTLERSFKSWRELADWLKNTKYRYRVSLDSFESRVFRLKSTKSTVSCRYLYV